MKNLILTLFTFLSLTITAQVELKQGEMIFRYEIIKDSIFCFLSAPTNGWIMVGFNSDNSTQLADFKFFAIKNRKIIAEDRKNIGGRNYPTDESLDGENNLRVYSGIEVNGITQISFAIPLISNDPNDYQFNLNQQFYLILAYSREDDFEHHSIYRKHIKYKWQSTQ